MTAISSSIRPFLRSASGGEAQVHGIEFFFREIEAQILAAVLQRVPAAVLAEHQLAFGHADRLRIDDLVGGAFLEVAVLVDAGLVRERVRAHNRLVRLRPEGDDARQQLAGRIQMLGVDAGVDTGRRSVRVLSAITISSSEQFPRARRCR